MNRRNFFSRLTGVTAALLAGVTLKRQQFPRPYDPEELERTALTWRCNQPSAERELDRILAEHVNRDIRNQMYARMSSTRLRSRRSL
jgi:hypothetical protein